MAVPFILQTTQHQTAWRSSLRPIHDTDDTEIEAIAATGARKSQILTHAIPPHAVLTFLGIRVFCWDINIRESAISGLLGANRIAVRFQSRWTVLAWLQNSLGVLDVLQTVVVSAGGSAICARRLFWVG